MEECRTISANVEAGKETLPKRPYRFSPKIVMVAGPPAAGKSFTARRLAKEFGYKLISLDSINPIVAERHGGCIEMTKDPKTFDDFKSEFSKILRESRYRDIVIEGCRLSYPHICQAFFDAVSDLYSPFTIMQPFYLSPPQEVRMDRYLLRKIRYAKESIKGRDPGVSKAAREKPYCDFLEPVLPGFAETPDCEPIIQWARSNRDKAHPGVPPEAHEVFKAVAEAESYNPFYQTIEYNGRILVPGFTDSPKAWTNILKLNVDFKDKTLCDYGCMHGYYTFKAEEAGAIGVGVDMDRGAIDLSNYLARKKQSECHFMVYDITTPLKQRYDIIMALNVLHRTGKFRQTTANMFRHCNECILEVGESQLPVIISEGTRQGFKLKRNIPSHRQHSCIGPRRILHLARQA